MKILFAGPSLCGVPSTCESEADIERRGPASQGDITRAVLEGATAIGLVDGRFGDIAAVWHKEILFALEQGVQVFGAASMGALRAAECAPFGMIGGGAVFERYKSGDLVDDAAVALLHAPAEMDYMPLTEALVNVEATIRILVDANLISNTEGKLLDRTARTLFFGDRTYHRLTEEVGVPRDRRTELSSLLRTLRRDVKREDAIALVAELGRTPEIRMPRTLWRTEPTYTWMETLRRTQASVPPAEAA